MFLIKTYMLGTVLHGLCALIIKINLQGMYY